MKLAYKDSNCAIRVFDKKDNDEVYSVYGLSFTEALTEMEEIKCLYHFGKNERFRLDFAMTAIHEVEP